MYPEVKKPLRTTNKSKVEYITCMGSDLSVVNAARVSFNKKSLWTSNTLSEKDKKLIHYLAKHNHWSPFAHTSIQLRVSAPIFVSRQLVKHQVGGVWNEVSRRYVDDDPVFYIPDKWRKRSESVKQGSSDIDTVKYLWSNQGAHNEDWPTVSEVVKKSIAPLQTLYNEMIREGVAPEQARMILPQNMMTSWYWTGSLMFFHRVFKQRTDSHSQKETRDVALQIGEICDKLYPVSWEALNLYAV